MYKIKIKSPDYSLVACDLSAAEVRTAINSACLCKKDYSMADVYKEITYTKEASSNKMGIYSYELLDTPSGKKSAHILKAGDIILDTDGNQYLITSKEYLNELIYLNYEIV